MEKLLKNWGFLITSSIAGLVVALTIVRCGSTTNSTFTSYQQIERLARPAINEGLVIKNADLNAFNEVPPSLDLSAAAAPVRADAVNTLTALYAGACYVYGKLGFSPAALTLQASGHQAIAPGGVACEATGDNIFSTPPGLNAAFAAAATTYAGNVAGYFLPDVLRIDTSQSPSTTSSPVGPSAANPAYNAVFCNAAATTSPLLCGGRFLTDDVMNVTYAFLLAGYASPAALGATLAFATGTNLATTALQTGVTYTGVSNNPNGAMQTPTLGAGNPNAILQGHKPLIANFPYSPAPY